MRTNCLSACAAGVLAMAGAAAAGDSTTTRVISISDEGSLLAGAATITTADGPASPPSPAMEIPQMPGFPTEMGVQYNFKPTRGLIFCDLTGDGDLEVVTSSTDGYIYAWEHDGTPVAGFPVGTIGWGQYAPSAADMDGDGDLEIVQFTRGQTSGGRVYALDHTGANLPGYPVSLSGNNIAASPTLIDLDGDGVMEIIAGERAYPIGYLHVLRLDGTEWGGNWPVALDHVPTGTAAVADVDDDGALEIFYMSYNSMYLLETDGTLLPGWPRGISGCNFSYQSAALADLDEDGDLEILVGAHKDNAGCYVFHHDGTGYPGWPKLVQTWTYCPPTVTDLEDDGVLDIVFGRAGVFFTPGSCFWVWDENGTTRPGFPYRHDHGGGSDGPMTVADINGDGVMEIFADHNVMEDTQGYLFGVDADGNDLPGFPLRPLGFTYMNGATVGDIDGDGDYELGVISSEDYIGHVNVYDLPDIYAANGREWPVYHARNSRGGEYAPGADCPPDYNGDGVLNSQDFIAFLNDFVAGNMNADYNGDGVLNSQDFIAFLNDFVDGC